MRLMDKWKLVSNELPSKDGKVRVKFNNGSYGWCKVENGELCYCRTEGMISFIKNEEDVEKWFDEEGDSING